MLNLVFGAGASGVSGASGASVPVTNLHIELRASRQLKMTFMRPVPNYTLFLWTGPIKMLWTTLKQPHY